MVGKGQKAPVATHTAPLRHVVRRTGFERGRQWGRVVPPIAQLVERRTVEFATGILRSLVQIRLGGEVFSLHSRRVRAFGPARAKRVSEVGFEPTPTFVDQNAPCSTRGKRIDP